MIETYDTPKRRLVVGSRRTSESSSTTLVLRESEVRVDSLADTGWVACPWDDQRRDFGPVRHAVRMVASSSISYLAQNLDRFLQSTRGCHSTDELVNLDLGERTIVFLMPSSVKDWMQDLSTSESIGGPLDITDIMLGAVQCRYL